MEEVNYKKLFARLESLEPPAELFDRIIAAIRREQELRHSKKLLFGFLSLFLISLIVVPLSGKMLLNQMQSSGIYYFISVAFGDFSVFLVLWRDFGLAILESLPITGIIAFAMSIGIFVFTLRLFFYKKRLLLEYLMR